MAQKNKPPENMSGERESATVTVQKRRKRTVTLDEKRKDNLR